MLNIDQRLDERLLAAVDEQRPLIFLVSDEIHDRPELQFEEVFASELLTRTFEEQGFKVTRGVSGMPTAFTAELDSGKPGPTVGFLAEYDALPNLGHGCGHNLIAASTVAGGVGVKAVLGETGGRLIIFGTPAEEGGGGKIPMVKDGLFDKVDAVMMVHHGGDVTSVPTEDGTGRCLAVSHRRYEFFGKTAHAAADPWKGANALNAVIHLFLGIDSLRQHLHDDVRIHGIISHGGDAPNVVPHYTSAEILVRAPEAARVIEVCGKVDRIAEAAAAMTETTTKISETGDMYYDMRPNYTLGRRYADNLTRVGLALHGREPGVGMYSTDFGNVSYAAPSSGCQFAISDEPIPGHSPQVVACSASDMGRENMLRAAKAMALTALEVLTDPALVGAIRDEYNASKA
ncbi:MAG: M20 family metallopeptidase [Anaerolineae bacterium]